LTLGKPRTGAAAFPICATVKPGSAKQPQVPFRHLDQAHWATSLTALADYGGYDWLLFVWRTNSAHVKSTTPRGRDALDTIGTTQPPGTTDDVTPRIRLPTS